ncbi:hypothetical protein EWM64_g63 [Hericium alpestre]|uniref:NAD(P)-binding protein n=1 Tax=Hericium alpestre TaxID=135208 RepID=A0A4Z0AC22_9AGAM|nr:hypothetical protein EWM64_g63 [Hericium alpestre]
MASSTVKRIGFMSQMCPPKPHWTADNVPDLSGQTIIVTGGSSGLGKETCRILLSKNAKVYMAVRSKEKAEAAIKDIKQSTKKSGIFFLQLDLADLVSCRKAAEEFLSKEQELHVLFDNGGIMFPPLDYLSEQGYDVQFGTNVLGHFFFTTLLMPALLRAAKSGANPTHKARIIHISSNGHELFTVPGGVDWDSLKKDDEALAARNKLGKYKLYGQSKLGNILLSNEFARRYGDQGIVSIAVHPGGIRTDLQRHSKMPFSALLERAVLYDVSFGVISQLYAGTAKEALTLNGQYLVPWARQSRPADDATDPKLMKKLWDWCEEQVKGF